MPALRNPSLGTAGTPGSGEAMSAYEQSREDRIRENLATMQKLGIFDLSLNLKLSSRAAKTPRSNSNSNSKTPPSVSPLIQSEPTRRSSRLKNGTPVSYSEMELGKKSKVALCDDEDLVSEVGSRPEIYTEKHEKLLGSTEKSWTLFVDGYGRDGKRIYDQVKGQTCHQCRQKTLGYRTHCIECNKVQGQFCGDCLYMRYGEHVLEARENPEWICPVCRGICNCSLCRQAKGWAPTGALYKKVTKLGHKSVAHYLIQTRRQEANSENNQDSVNEVSVKRSLAFSDVEQLSKDSVKVTDDKPGSLEELKDEDVDEFKNNSDAKDSTKRLLLFSDETPACESTLSQIKDARNELKEAVEKVLDGKHIVNKFPLAKEMNGENPATPNLKQIFSAMVTVNSDSIAERLKQRPGKSNDYVSQAVKSVLPENEVEKQIELLPPDVRHLGYGNTPMAKTRKLKQKLALAIIPSEGSIAGRLGQRVLDSRRIVSKVSAEKETDQENTTTPNLWQICSTMVTVDLDSISGRLKQRRRKSYECNQEMSGDNQAVEGVFPENEVEKQIVVLPLDVKYPGDGITPMAKTPKLKQKLALGVPSQDSIAGRLRQRRKMGDRITNSGNSQSR